MMPYAGIDIIEIHRIKKAVDRWGERFLRNIYTDAELRLYDKKLQSLAARFAAKEAVMKLLGARGKGFSFRDIETLSQSDGQPILNLYGRAKSEAERLGISEIAVSLAHTGEYALATAIAFCTG